MNEAYSGCFAAYSLDVIFLIFRLKFQEIRAFMKHNM